MTAILSNLISDSISYALGYTIIHSLWQVSLLALLMSVLHNRWNNKSAVLRYNTSIITMVLSVLASVITFFIYYNVHIATGIVATEEGMLTAYEASISQDTSTIFGDMSLWLSSNLIHINTVWTMGVILFFGRFLFSWGYVTWIRKSAQPLENRTVSHVANKLKQALAINTPVRVMESLQVSVPMVLGHIRPIILFPVGMVTMLSQDEIEAILLHELSHIRRSDYLVNMVSALVEVVYFFHPGMWWICANIKSERENCCDDAAINANIDAVAYAKTLVKLEDIRTAGIPALAIPLHSGKHQLLNRIKRILNMQQTKNDLKQKSMAIILLMGVFVFFALSSYGVTAQQTTSAEIEEVQARAVEMQENAIAKSNEYAVVQERAMEEQRLAAETLEEAAVDQRKAMAQVYSAVDTLPKKNNKTVTIITKTKGKSVELHKENDEITSLKIDGKVIPQSEFGKHIDLIEDADINVMHSFEWSDLGGNMDSLFGHTMMMFDSEELTELSGNALRQLSELKELEHLQELEVLKDLDVLKHLENMPEILEGVIGDAKVLRFDLEALESLEGLEGLEGLRGLEGLERLEELENWFEENGEGRFPELEEMQEFRFFGLDDHMPSIGGNTVVDQLGSALNKDGLLEANKNNKIELSGKRLKINGDKMPKALFNKYKNIYQEATGAPLTKKSKMVFDIMGKPSKRTVRTF